MTFWVCGILFYKWGEAEIEKEVNLLFQNSLKMKIRFKFRKYEAWMHILNHCTYYLLGNATWNMHG